MNAQRVLLHPIAVLVLPIPAIVCILLADGVAFGLVCLTVGLVLAGIRGPRLGLTVLVAALAGLAMLWTGFTISLPAAPGDAATIGWLPWQPTLANALIALRGAQRVVAIMVLYTATLAYVRWDVLADTLIDRFRMPYRVVDVVGLGGRFVVLIGADVVAARSLARLRARGHPLRTLRLLSGLTIPVLISAFRHADLLTIAMEARGFGALPDRTVHRSVPLRVRDGVVVAAVWTLTVVLAIAGERFALQ